MEGWRTLREIPQLKWSGTHDRVRLSSMQDAGGDGRADSGPVSDGHAVPQHAHPHLRRIPVPVRAVPRRTTLTRHSDAEGAIVRPIARCKRALCEPNVLPHLVQVM